MKVVKKNKKKTKADDKEVVPFKLEKYVSHFRWKSKA